MLNSNFHLKHHNARQEHIFSEAAHQRLVRQLISEQPTQAKWHHRALATLGSLLITWGSHLESRYPDMIATKSSVNV